MKKTILTSTIIALSSISVATAAVDPTESNTGDIHLFGEVEKKCVLNLDRFNNAPQLIDLSYPVVKTAGRSIRTWCNTDVNPSISFDSVNDGYLVHQDKGDKKIKYTAWMDGFGDIDLTGAARTMPNGEFGQGEDYHQRPIRYTPQVNGLEVAGNYSDTITVTITPN